MNRRNWFNSAFVGVLGLCGFKLQDTQDWQWQWWHDEKANSLYLELNGINVDVIFDIAKYLKNLDAIMDLTKQQIILRLEKHKLMQGNYPAWMYSKMHHDLHSVTWQYRKEHYAKYNETLRY